MMKSQIKKVRGIITQRQTNPADVSYYDPNSILNIVDNFQNANEKINFFKK